MTFENIQSDHDAAFPLVTTRLSVVDLCEESLLFEEIPDKHQWEEPSEDHEEDLCAPVTEGERSEGEGGRAGETQSVIREVEPRGWSTDH